jgi:predicted nucleic acid-binding protein
MTCLLDTSILVRLVNAADVLHPFAARAVTELHRRGEVASITAQVLVEFRAVATRPVSANGVGMTAAAAETGAAGFEAAFPLLAETPAIFPTWKALVAACGVIGKQVHDARLVAVCHAHGVKQLLTFNVPHFARLAGHGPGLVVLDAVTF